jgi:hypothetical protein
MNDMYILKIPWSFRKKTPSTSAPATSPDFAMTDMTEHSITLAILSDGKWFIDVHWPIAKELYSYSY